MHSFGTLIEPGQDCLYNDSPIREFMILILLLIPLRHIEL